MDSYNIIYLLMAVFLPIGFAIVMSFAMAFFSDFILIWKNGYSGTRSVVLNAVAHTHNLKYVKGGFLGYPKGEGEIEGLPVFLCWKKSAILEISIWFDNSDKKQFSITSKGEKTVAADFSLDSGLVKSGDDIFDSLLDINVAKRPDKVIAILTFGIREKIISLSENSYHLSLSNNSICVTDIKSKSISYASIISILDKMVSISKFIISDNDFKKLHINNIKYDKVANVKLLNLKMLLENYRKDKEINDMLKSSVSDWDYMVQYKAAKYLGIEGFYHVVKLVRERKIEGDNLLLDALRDVGKRNFRKAADSLIQEFHNVHEESFRLNILDTLKKLGDERFSSFLLSLLEHSDDDIVNGAVDALSTCGDVHAVEKILDVAGRSINPFFRSKLNETVLQIQSKLGLAKKGWLSVTDPRLGEGKLSLVDGADEGSLSIAYSDLKKSRPAAKKS